MSTLEWKVGEGYDVHLLRGGAGSKPLAGALEVSAAASADALAFIPKLLGEPADHGVEINTQSGVVKAGAHPAGSSFPRIANFLLEAVHAPPGSSETSRTIIRIHVHDSVEVIRLTPSPLTLRHESPDKYRLTALARFSDGVVGDITDWAAPQLTFTTSNPAVADVLSSGKWSDGSSPDPGSKLPDGALWAKAKGEAEITATATQPTGGAKVATARVVVDTGWKELAESSIVTFVGGGMAPNPQDPDSSARNSVKSVIEGARNVVLIAEGFRQPLRGDFNNLVKIIIEELQTKEYLQPFNMLKKSINYWSVFTPSRDGEEGVSLLGDYTTGEHELEITITGDPPAEKVGLRISEPQPPSPTAIAWSLVELIHEVGLPPRAEAGLLSGITLPDHLGRWTQAFGGHVTKERVEGVYLDWRDLAFRSPLSERNTVFGMATGSRARASPEWGDLKRDFRRASDESIRTFVQNLTFGGHPIGGRWVTGGKDFGLIAFVCHSDISAGNRLAEGYMTTSLGKRWHVPLKKTPGWGLDFKTSEPRTHSRKVCASVLAHELSHALGVTDEYGDGGGKSLVDGSAIAGQRNVQAKSAITSVSGGATTYDKTENIKWRWPRLLGAGIATGAPTPLPPAPPSPPPSPSQSGLQVALRSGHGRGFHPGEEVRFRLWPLSTEPAQAEPFALFHKSNGVVLKVSTAHPDDVTLDLLKDGVVADSSWRDKLLQLFASDKTYALVRPLAEAGVEQSLVAEPIRTHIASHGPLNAAAGAACVAAHTLNSEMTPRDLPALSRAPRNTADIVGVYEGGWYHDCGVFRPAGRCKMRSSQTKTTPFCHVCRYIIVDVIDPTVHGELDKLYPVVKP